MNQHDAYLTRKANEVVAELQRSPEMLHPAVAHYELIYHQAMISIYAPQEITEQLNILADCWRRAKLEAELYSNYLQTKHFPDSQEFFCLLNICCAAHLVPLEFEELMIDKALSQDITESSRLLLFKIFTQRPNVDIFEPLLLRKLEMLNDKEFLRKEREIVPYLLFLTAIRSQDHLLTFLNGKFDKFRRHVSRNFFFNAMAHGIYSERLSTIARYVGQNMPILQAVLSDKKHFHCVFSCIAEYAIAEREFLNSQAFIGYIKVLKENPLIGMYEMSRIVSELCYNRDIFDESPLPIIEQVENEQLQDFFVEMYLLVNRAFNNTIMKMEDYLLLDNMLTSREKYFCLLPYYQMMPPESQPVSDFMIYLIGQVVALNQQYFMRILPKGNLLDLVMLAVPNLDQTFENKNGINENIVLPLLLRKVKIQKCEKQLISLLQSDISNIYLKDLLIFIRNMAPICGEAEVQSVLAVVLQKIKHYRFFSEIIELLESFKFVLSNINFLYSVIMLLLTIYLNDEAKIERVLNRILQQINFFSTPKTKEQVLQDVLEDTKQKNEAFYEFVQRELLWDEKEHSENVRNTVLLYYFQKAAFLKEMVKEQLIIAPSIADVTRFVSNYSLPFTIPEEELANVCLEPEPSSTPKEAKDLEQCGESSGCILLEYFDECDKSEGVNEKFAYYWALWFTHSADLQKTNDYFKRWMGNPKIDNTNKLLELLTSPIYRKALLQISVLLDSDNSGKDIEIGNYNKLLILCFPFFMILNSLPNIQIAANTCIKKAPDSIPSRTLQGLCKQSNPSITEYLSALFQFFTGDRLNETLARPILQDEFSSLELVSYTQFCIFSHNLSVQLYNFTYASSSNSIQKLRALGRVFEYSFQQTCQVSTFITLSASAQVKELLPEYYNYILSLIINSIRTNIQFCDIMSFYIGVRASASGNEYPCLGKREKQVFEMLQGMIDQKAFRLLLCYDYSIRLNLQALDNALPNKENVTVYYEDAKEILEALRDREHEDPVGEYVRLQIVEYDISKQVEFQFNSRIDESRSQEYFTIAELLILLNYLYKFPNCRDDCMATMRLLLEDRIDQTWIRSISEYVEQERLVKFEELDKIVVFIPGFFFAYNESLRSDLPLDQYIEEHITLLSSVFISESFVLSVNIPKLCPGNDFSSFEACSDNDSSFTSNSSMSSVVLMTTTDERTQLSEAFLKFFLQFIAISKSKNVSDILVNYFSDKYDDMFIVKLIQFICHNRYFLQHYEIGQINVTSHEKRVKIVSKPSSKALSDKSPHSTAFQKSQFNTPPEPQAKKTKFMISNIQDMSVREFDFNIMEQIIVDVAQQQSTSVLQYLQSFTLNGESESLIEDSEFLHLYLVDAERKEFIYGFEARNVIVKILRKCLEDGTKIDEEELHNSLYILITDGYFVDCVREQRAVEIQDSISSAYKGEPSLYAPSSKHSDSFYENANYHQVILSVRENYYFDKLFGARVGQLVNAHKFKDDEDKKYGMMQLYCREMSEFKDFNVIKFCIHLALRIKQFGILHNEYGLFPWMCADQYYESYMGGTTASGQEMANMMPLQHNRHFSISVNNRRRLMFVILTLLQQEKAALHKYQTEDVDWLLLYMFSNYCNHCLLMSYTNALQLREEESLEEKSILIVLEDAMARDIKDRLLQFAEFIKILKLNIHSRRFAWELFEAMCAGMNVETLERDVFFEAISLTDFERHIQFCEQQSLSMPLKLSISATSQTIEASLRVKEQKGVHWLDNNLKKVQTRQISRNPGGDFYKKSVHTFIVELQQHSGIQLEEQLITEQYATANISGFSINFAVSGEKLESYEYFALILAEILNILIVKSVTPQAPVADMAVPIIDMLRHIKTSPKSEFDELCKMVETWLCQFYNMEYGIMNYPESSQKSFTVGYLASLVSNKVLLLQKLTFLVQCRWLELPALLVMAEIGSQLCRQNLEAELENVNFGRFPASYEHTRAMQEQLVSRYNYRSVFPAVRAVADRYEQLRQFTELFSKIKEE